MALVATKVFDAELEGGINVRAVTLAWDNSYPTNGESITANGVRLVSILMAIIPGYKGFTFEWDPTNLKVKAFQGDNTNAAAAPGIEFTNGGDLSALTAAPALFFGI